MISATSFSAVGRSTSYFASTLSTTAFSVVSVFSDSTIKAAVGLLLISPLNFVPVVETVICSPFVSCVRNFGFSFIYFSDLCGTRGSSIGSLLLERVLLVVITSSVSNSTTSILGVIYSSFIRGSPYFTISGVLTAALLVYRWRLCRTAYPAPPVWLSAEQALMWLPRTQSRPAVPL